MSILADSVRWGRLRRCSAIETPQSSNFQPNQDSTNSRPIFQNKASHKMILQLVRMSGNGANNVTIQDREQDVTCQHSDGRADRNRAMLCQIVGVNRFNDRTVRRASARLVREHFRTAVEYHQLARENITPIISITVKEFLFQVP